MKKIFSLFITTLFCASLLADHYIAGSFTNWETNKKVMETIGETTCSKVTIDIQTGAWETFKVIDGSNWLGQSNASGNIDKTSLAYALDGTNNINLDATTKGEYTFIYNYDKDGDKTYVKTVSVLFPNMSIIAVGAEGLFGSNWDGTDINNQLTDDDSDYTYTLVKENVSLAAGQYAYKVKIEDKTYFPGGDNLSIEIAESGKYDVTITFNILTQAVSASATLKEPEVVLPTIVLNGNWGADAAWEDLELTPDEGNQTASATKSFAATALGTYEFGVKVNGNWTSNGSETTFSRSNYSVKLTGYSGNMKLFVDVVEPLTFTWEYSSNTLTITYPELSAQPVICGYATWNGKDFSTVEFTPAGDNKSASYTRTLVAGTYLFRIVKNGTKISINGTNPDDKYRCVFHRDWNAAVIGGGTNDMIIRTDIQGSYTLKWTYENDSLTIIYPELPAIKYYVAHNFASEDVVATATEMTEDAGVWSASTTISGTAAKKFKIYSVQGPYETWYGALNAENNLAATTAEPWELTSTNGGSDINITPNGGTGDYIFSFNPENKQLNVTFPSATTTAIGNANGNDTPKKFVKDGVIYILRNGCVYDCNGRRAE